MSSAVQRSSTNLDVNRMCHLNSNNFETWCFVLLLFLNIVNIQKSAYVHRLSIKRLISSHASPSSPFPLCPHSEIPPHDYNLIPSSRVTFTLIWWKMISLPLYCGSQNPFSYMVPCSSWHICIHVQIWEWHVISFSYIVFVGFWYQDYA